MVKTITPVRSRKRTTGEKERTYTRVFHMENDTANIYPWSYKTDKTIQTGLPNSEGSRTISDVSDKRGKRIPGNKLSNDISDKVNSHILSFNHNKSHYHRKHGPNKLYISLEFNVSMIQ